MFPQRSTHHIRLWLGECWRQWLRCRAYLGCMPHSLGSADGQITLPVLTSLSVFSPLCSQSKLSPHSSRRSSQRVSSNSLPLVALSETKDLIKMPRQKLHLTLRLSFYLVPDSASQRLTGAQRSGLSLRLGCDFVVCKTEIRIKNTALSSSSLCQPSCCAGYMGPSQCSSH